MNMRQANCRKYLYKIGVMLLGAGWLCSRTPPALACHIYSMTVTSAQCVPFVQDGQPVPKTYSCEQGAEIAFTPYFTMETKAAFQSLQWLLDGTPMKTSLDQSDLSFTYTMNAAGKQRMQAILRCTIENSPISNSFSVYPIVNFTLKILPKSGVKVIGSTGTGDGILCEPADAGTSRCQETYSGLQGAGVKAIVVKEGAALLGWKVNGKFVTPEEFMQTVTGQ